MPLISVVYDRYNLLPPRGDFKLRADVRRDLSGIEVNEAADFVVRDATELRPVAQRADRRLFAGRKNTASAKADDVDEL